MYIYVYTYIINSLMVSLSRSLVLYTVNVCDMYCTVTCYMLM